MGTLLPVTTPSPPTTIAPPPRPDLEASNQLNNVPYPVDGPNVSTFACSIYSKQHINIQHTTLKLQIILCENYSYSVTGSDIHLIIIIHFMFGTLA